MAIIWQACNDACIFKQAEGRLNVIIDLLRNVSYQRQIHHDQVIVHNSQNFNSITYVSTFFLCFITKYKKNISNHN